MAFPDAFNRTLIFATSLVVLLYFAVGLGGYLTFGNLLQGDITSNLESVLPDGSHIASVFCFDCIPNLICGACLPSFMCYQHACVHSVCDNCKNVLVYISYVCVPFADPSAAAGTFLILNLNSAIDLCGNTLRVQYVVHVGYWKTNESIHGRVGISQNYNERERCVDYSCHCPFYAFLWCVLCCFSLPFALGLIPFEFIRFINNSILFM